MVTEDAENEAARGYVAALQFGFRMGVDETLRAQRKMSDFALTAPDGSIDDRLSTSRWIDMLIGTFRSNMPPGWTLVPEDLCGEPFPGDSEQRCDRSFEHAPLAHTAGDFEWAGPSA